ncbi:MAG: type I DNA topoisomerase [Deltaproteobacteria bacterium]|nr:type I DNA topoisomerase [Deltaproteobacteria bacterium]
MGKALVIVESPAKAKTIAKYLGKDYIVESSIGHIRDLPGSAAEIPAHMRKKPWARTGVDVENDFAPLYVVPAEKKAQVAKLKILLADANALFLATDEDREGEAIAWHLREVLNPKVPVKRMVFHEITESAIKHALQSPRAIDQQLVDAQEARRILDRLYGYEVSPVLWRKIAQGLSAGRVQSVAVRLIVERERARIAFHSGDYWSVAAELVKQQAGIGAPQRVKSELIEVDAKRVAVGKDFDPNSGKLTDAARERVVLLDEAKAKALESQLGHTTFTVSEVQKKPFTDRPHPPFITSTLQQESARKLRFTAQRTMRTAQRLYESGFITYMRTDSTTLSTQAVDAARAQINELYGDTFLPPGPRQYATKAKGAQEAHEAIRPAGEAWKTPEQLKGELDEDGFRLYDLIWKRTVASQMKDAQGERTTVRMQAKVAAGVCTLQTTGKVILFPGYLRAYVEGTDDPEAELEDQERILPPLAEGELLDPEKIEAEKHTTQPPARYTEASLVKELEEKGIGRPSTYASIIGTIQDRGYVFKKGTALVPTFTAFAVINLLEQHFKELVDYTFTASMEADLDAISEGEKKATPWLKRFYFGESGKMVETLPPESVKHKTLDEVGLHVKVHGGSGDIDPRGISEIPLGKDQQGQLVAARVGRYGPYVQIGDSDRRANIPEDIAPDELTLPRAIELLQQASEANRAIGTDAATGKPIFVKTGRYGPYVQLGEMQVNDKGKPIGDKPRMASLWPGMTVKDITQEQALLLLSFPKNLGPHPDTGVDVVANDGKFGPYVRMEGKAKDGTFVKETRSLPDREAMRALDLAQAVELLKQPRQIRGRQVMTQPPLAMLGPSPVTGQTIVIKTGRFGAYVTDGQVNATIPSGREPARLTLDDALELIAARESRLREQGIDPRAPGKAGKAGGRRRFGGAARAPAPARAVPAAKAAKSATATRAPTKAPTKAKGRPAPAARAPSKKVASRKAAGKTATAKKPSAKKAPKPTKKKAKK